MSLIEAMMEKFVTMERVKTSDGEGGFTTSWTEGAEILAAAVMNSSMTARIAEQQGVTSTYTITTKKNASLEYHDVLKRESDGKIFRITSDHGDIESPAVSTLDIQQYTAEKWELTS